MGFSTDLQERLAPWMTSEWEVYTDAIGVMFEPVASLVQDSATDPAWGSVLNPTTFDTSSFNIGYPAQFLGITLPPDASIATDLQMMAQEQGFTRGSPGAILTAVTRSLVTTPIAAPTLIERTDAFGSPNAFWFVVIINIADIPNSITTTGTTASGSPIVTAIPSTAAMTVGAPIAGAPIPGLATILSVDSSSQIHLSTNATSSATATPIVVANQVAYNVLVANITATKPGGVLFTIVPTVGVTWAQGIHAWNTTTTTWAQSLNTVP